MNLTADASIALGGACDGQVDDAGLELAVEEHLPGQALGCQVTLMAERDRVEPDALVELPRDVSDGT